MPKKAATARRRVQHNKPKAQKTFELVHSESTETETKESNTTSTKAPVATQAETKTQERQNTPVPGSASARLAARRQAAQRAQQRSATTLITSEHFAYVRKDLIRIAAFAVVMFTASIVLYLTLGRA